MAELLEAEITPRYWGCQDPASIYCTPRHGRVAFLVAA